MGILGDSMCLLYTPSFQDFNSLQLSRGRNSRQGSWLTKAFCDNVHLLLYRGGSE